MIARVWFCTEQPLVFTLLTCMALGAASSCGAKIEVTSVGGAAGVAGPRRGGGGSGSVGGGVGLASGEKPQAGSSGVAPGTGGGGGDEIPSAGGGGVDDVGGIGGSGEPPRLPGHAGRICDPHASYGSPLPAPSKRTATRLSSSYFLTEGPVWVESGGFLLFTDFYDDDPTPGAHIRRFTPPNTFDTFIEDANTNGLALSADGLTLFAARRIRTTPASGEVASYSIASKTKQTVLADLIEPKDLATRSDGTIYFSAGSIYRIDPNHDWTFQFHVDGQGPTSVTLSPDEITLYSSWSLSDVYASALAVEGAAGAPAPLATPQEGGPPPRLCVDCAGNLYAADYTNGIIQVFDKAGQYLGKITLPAATDRPTDMHATNVAFGGADHRTLFITSHRGEWKSPSVGELHSIELYVPGLPY